MNMENQPQRRDNNAVQLPERGAVAAEYAVLMALITLALVAIINGLTGGIINTFQAVINVLP